MHTIWKGSISFGLINIPVRVSGAVEPSQVSFHQYHEPCKSRIRYKKYCPNCDKDVYVDEIVKGLDTPGGVITVTDSDLEDIQLDTLKIVELAGFIKEQSVDPLYYQKPYYLLPENNRSEQPYWLLYNALKKSGKVGIARFSVHSREHLALVRPAKGMLTLSSLYYPEEIREVETIGPANPNPKHMELAMNLIEQQTVPFEPEQFKDRYREALEAMLSKKQPEAPANPASSPQIVDLLEALRQSVEKAKDKQKSA